MIRRLHRFFVRSIPGRLTLVVVAVLLPASVLTSWLILRAYTNERLAVERNLTESARGLATLINVSLQEREALLRGLATSRQLELEDFAAFRAQCAQVLRYPEEWIVLAGVGGRQLVNTGQPAGAALPQAVAPEDLRATLEGQGHYISNVTIGPATGGPLVYLTIPVLRDGRPPLALSIVMTTNAVSRMFLDHGIGTGWLIALIDREGTIVSRNRDPEQFIGQRASDNIVEVVSAHTTGIIESVTLDGVESLTAFNRVSRAGWTVILAAPRKELLHGPQLLAVVAATVSILSGFLAIILAASAGRAVVRGVRRLVAQTKRLGEDDGARLPTGLDETDIVSRALDDAARALRNREAELARARDVAVAASRAKDEFLATLSHELRTPLNPVLLVASDAAGDDTLSPDVRERFETIVKNVKLEARLIDDLLDLTRITRGKVALERRSLDLHAVLADALATVDGEAKTKGIALNTDWSAEATTVIGDAIRLQQVFWNILINAIKFTPPGGHVNVATRSDDTAIEVTITDSGLGLTAEELAKIFQSFTQGDHATGGTGSPFGGLGLGLTISQLLVERHGGRITAASPGRHQGATFTVALPLVQPQQATAAEGGTR